MQTFLMFDHFKNFPPNFTKIMELSHCGGGGAQWENFTNLVTLGKKKFTKFLQYLELIFHA